MKRNRGFLLSTALVMTLAAFGIYLYRITGPGRLPQPLDRATTSRPRQGGALAKATSGRPVDKARRQLAELVAEVEAMPQSDRLDRLQPDRLEKIRHALVLFRSLAPGDYAPYLAEIDALEIPGDTQRILLGALFQAWGEKAPEEAIATAETRESSEEAKATLVGWAAGDMSAPWQWLAAHPGMAPVLGEPKANYMQALIPAMAGHGDLAGLAALVDAIPEKPIKEFALSFLASAVMAESPEYAAAWLQQIPAPDLAMPAQAIGSFLARQGLDALHEFVAGQEGAIQEMVIQGAVMNWTLNGQGGAVLEYVKRYPGPDDASDDRLLRAIGLAAVMGNAEASLQLLGGIRSSEMRDVSLEGAAALLTASAPGQALKFTQEISDPVRQQRRFELIVTAVTRRSPDVAQALVEGSSLPESTKAKLKSLIGRPR